MKNRDKTSARAPGPRRRASALLNKLHESNAKLAAIVESSDDAIFSKDLNGIITSWNKGAEKIYGYRAEEVLGRPVSILVPPGLTDEVSLILKKIRQGETIEHFETLRVRKDGRQLNMSVTISPIRSPSGRITGSSTIGRDITRRIKDREVIQRQAYLLNQIRESVITTDLSGIITGWNRGATRLYSYTEEEALGRHISLIYPDNQRTFIEQGIIAPLMGKGEHEVEVRLRRKSGEEFHALVLLSLLRDGAGKVTGMVGSSVDISARKKMEDNIRLAKEEWEQTFDAMPDIVAVIDNQHVIRRANKALATRLGIDRDRLLGAPCYRILCGLEKPLFTCPGSMSIAAGKGQVEERFLDPLRGYYFISCTPILAPDGSIASFVEVCRDISEQKKMEQKLQKAAVTDELTGLLNRRGFLAAAEHQLHVADRENRNLALVFMDLNDMKEINDRFSHQTGDSALRDTANLLRKTFRESDIIARLGGDEFAALLAEPPDTDIEKIVTGHLQRNVDEQNAHGGRQYELSLSVGVAHYDPRQRTSLGDLMTKADALMYRQKQQYKQEREAAVTPAGKKEDKRLYNRIIVDERWWAEIGGVGRCRIKNISEKGVCVETPRSVGSGSRHTITIHAPHRDFSQEAVAIWSRSTVQAREDGGRQYESGMSIAGEEENAQLLKSA